MKYPFTTTGVRPLIAVLLLLTSLQGSAREFAELGEEILQREASLKEVELALGYYEFQLIEQWQQLAQVQLQANRFDDAEHSVERAVQITRYHEGLYSARQLPLRKLAIGISFERQDWESARERLQQLTRLLATPHGNDIAEHLQHLLWLSNAYALAAERDRQHRAAHLIRATTVSEHAVQLAQLQRQTESPIYPQLLFALAQRYYDESIAIKDSGNTSYQLRLVSHSPPVAQGRFDAIEYRYLLGLEKLMMLKQALADSSRANQAALDKADGYIADWESSFPKGGSLKSAVASLFGARHEAPTTLFAESDDFPPDLFGGD